MNEATWGVRRARNTDLPTLLHLETTSFGEPWSLELLGDALSDPKYLVLCLEDLSSQEVLGYIAAWSVLDEGQIDRLAVLPTRRRLGLGRLLLDAALDAFRRGGVALVFLEVRAGNAAARALYARAGFEEVGARRAYYEDGEDAIVLRFGEPAESGSAA